MMAADCAGLQRARPRPAAAPVPVPVTAAFAFSKYPGGERPTAAGGSAPLLPRATSPPRNAHPKRLAPAAPTA